MKDRLITLLAALLALGIVIVLFFPADQNNEQKISLPTTEDGGTEGLKGLFVWLQREHQAVLSFRKRYTDLLTEQDLAKSGNLLVINIPVSREIKPNEWDALAKWLNQGNNLIILAAVYSEPDWAKSGVGLPALKDFLEDFGWELKKINPSVKSSEADHTHHSSKSSLKKQLSKLQANFENQLSQDTVFTSAPIHSLLNGVKTVQSKTLPSLLHTPWTVVGKSDSDNISLRLLSFPTKPLPSAWLLNTDYSQIAILLTPDIFSNTQLGHADNALFFDRLMSRLLTSEGKILFDDYHFGLSKLYDPDNFFKDPRLHKTLACLLVFWLCYALGHTNRLAPVRNRTSKLSSRDFLEVIARFFARKLDKSTLSEALVNHFLTDLHKRRSLNQSDTWQWLAQHGQVSRPQIELLKKAQARQSVSLLDLTNTLTQLRTKLL